VQNPVNQRGFTVVDVGNNGNVSDILHVKNLIGVLKWSAKVWEITTPIANDK
jgi:hypothetical protein